MMNVSRLSGVAVSSPVKSICPDNTPLYSTSHSYVSGVNRMPNNRLIQSQNSALYPPTDPSGAGKDYVLGNVP
jgi:hypothetical protein